MREEIFINKNQDTWKKFETSIRKLNKKSVKALNFEELEDFMSLYNSLSKNLSYARTHYESSNTTLYLNNLVSKAHEHIYASPKSSFKLIFGFFREIPEIFKKNIRLISISTAIFLLGTILSFIFTMLMPENLYTFLPPQYSAGIEDRVPSFEDTNDVHSSISSSSILTNNITVGIFSFALGLSLGIGTVVLLLYNGYMLGCLAAIFYQKGANLLFWSLILPHGFIELFAIFVCGGTGLMIGYSLINPGRFSRKDSLILTIKPAAKLLLSTIPLFIIAGIIEGFITPYSIPGYGETLAYFKLGFSFITLILITVLVAYCIRNNQTVNYNSQAGDLK